MSASDAMTIELTRQALAVLCGPAGCGKTTFARRHFHETQIVQSDACRAMISDNPDNQKVSGRAFQLFHFIIRQRLAFGRVAVADSTALERSARRQLLRIAAECERPAVLIVFNVPFETCLERDARRERTVGREVIERHCAKVQGLLPGLGEEGFDRIYVLDAESMDRAQIEFIGPEAFRKKTLELHSIPEEKQER